MTSMNIYNEDDDDDRASTFTYGEGEPDTFNLSQLQAVVGEHFGTQCTLTKLAEGGYHKVYNIVDKDGQAINAVVRVASSAFPGDKMKSEVATLRYIAAHSAIPVPKIYVWNANASNSVGAEYMIMQKVPGISPSDNWKDLPIEIKVNVVTQVAEHIATLFYLRFNKAGSLYEASDFFDSSQTSGYAVGPIIRNAFYRQVEGVSLYPDMSAATLDALSQLRGPFTRTGDYLSSPLRAELLKATTHRTAALTDIEAEDDDTAELRLENGLRALRKAVDLCYVYPGDLHVHGPITTPDRPFTLKLDDFRLVNILIDGGTGRINGYIDFEGATASPLWECAKVPDWIPDPNSDMANWYGGTPEDQRRLWSTFHATIDRFDRTGEWRRAYENGAPFRRFVDHLELDIGTWADVEPWLDERLAWAKEHPGVGMKDPEDLL